MNKPSEQHETHILVEAADDSPVNLLHRATGLSNQRIKTAMTQGAVWITRGSTTQRLRRAKRALRAGDELHLYYNERILAEVPNEPTLLADIGGYSVWRKPYGLRSQGSKWGDHCTIGRWAEKHLEPERPAFTVHRLDRAANGLILVAHSKSVAAALAKLFQERKIKKCYRAIVAGDFSRQPLPVRVEQLLDKKAARSEISFLQLSADSQTSLVDVRIETGRKHQIRRHLAALGHPVYGDRLYGTGEEDGVDLQLTAHLLAFHCPVNDEPVEYSLPPEWMPAFS
jgi:tRNA pseudouridine32 synthase/23S rRNA pseudouridine746 synthase